ncbi:hypothetical protein [Antarcticirhabdus aurantiaca]|uniref:Uncharacterized protein n=1 Tax=Antarcticirhabdus aurantiaca TaxID=2606717 RepID=A0ACD4NJW1_9HYPH|nr:hypothetical protein [Antarcticirhabdus aurantiaca]WAJ27117.1 hypothetical protein OXU80_20005 [Jeongeuplla avenae]
MAAHEMADPSISPDQQPGFWPNWQAPTLMAEAIQMPLHPPHKWINGVLNAHRKTGRPGGQRDEGGCRDAITA